MSAGSTDERQRRAEEIFAAAIERPRAGRTAFIAERCGDDRGLREEVALLVKFSTDAGPEAGPRFLDPAEIRHLTVGVCGLDASGGEGTELAPGTLFADFVIKGVLGVGGMGVVYEAEQERPRRIVALKVIRRGLASAGMVRRFEHEAEILGCLQHPGIAQVYQAGSGMIGGVRRPYIAMELVRGQNLTRHAESAKLDTKARLALMAGVCDAVHHAHVRGVIHRDLKPANVLVVAEGGETLAGERGSSAGVATPKILDFGVARASTVDLRVTTIHTSVGQLIGTLAYMSPEQVQGNPSDIDTRSDVYALGVMLYELLTGRLPFDLDSRSIPEAARMIREEAPARLSHFSRVYRGELDTIVAKAMDKDKTRRYQSALELGEDLRRAIRGDAIHAKQDSAFYVLRKAVRRHRVAAAAGVLIVAGLVVFSIYAFMQAQIQGRLVEAATGAQRTAIVERDRANTTSEVLARELTEARIERGRLEGVAGNVGLAEDILWREHFADPRSQTARWGLWELYHNSSIRTTVQGLARPSCAAVHAPSGLTLLGNRTEGGTLAVYGGAEPREVARVSNLGTDPRSVAIAADGSWALIGLTNGKVARWSASEPGTVTVVTPEPLYGTMVRRIALSGDGGLVATADETGAVKVHNTRTWEMVMAVTQAEPCGSLVFSPDATILAAGCRNSKEGILVRLWRVGDGSMERMIDVGGDSNNEVMCFSRDGRKLWASDHARMVRVHDLETGESVQVATDHGLGTHAMALSPDGERMFMGGADAVFSADGLGTKHELGRQRNLVLAAGWVDESSLLVVTTGGEIRRLDTRASPALTLIDGFRSWCFSTAFSPDGGLLAIGAGDGTVALIDPATMQRVRTVTLSRTFIRTRGLRFLADGRTLLCASEDGKVRRIDARTGRARVLANVGRSELFCIDVDVSQRWMAVGSADRVMRVFDLETGAAVFASLAGERRIEGLAFSPDGGTLATTGLTDGVQVWSTSAWMPVASLKTTGLPWAPVYSPDGKTMLVATHDGAIDIFEARSGRRTASIVGHQRLIPGIAFSSDGKYFATGAETGNLKLWDAKTYRSLANFNPDSSVIVGVSFSPSGRHVAAATGSRTTAVYDLHAMDKAVAANREFQRGRLGFGARPSR